MVTEYDKGSAVTIEVEFKKYTAFGEYAYFDPSSHKITVTDTNGNVKIDAVDLVKEETGKYYYIVQTETDWITGKYETKISSSDPTNTDITKDGRSFYLK